ncbi:phosphotransferase family protein [Marinobacter sp.]|uniref:phosphotransferase family protein n=1 Tax=Marinobacter sp. TaxID=50741 RepID=UPI0034A4F423
MSNGLAETFADFIADRTGAREARVVAFNKLSGGAIQDNFGLTIALTGGTHSSQHQLVVRQDAPSGVPESLTRPQEFAVLKAAFEAGVTAPQPLWLCEDERVSGHIFYVMTRAAGTASPKQLVKTEHSPQARSKLTRRFGEELARLHSIRPPAAGLDFLPLPQSQHPALSRVSLYRRYLAEIAEPHPVLEWALNWLEDRAPEPGPTVLCHCDFRTGNYMMDGDELTAVLDWEFATWSDPCEDLGWLCSRSWRFGQDLREVGGMGDKTDLLAGYQDISGTDIDPRHVSYWEVMALVRWAMIALQQARRHMSGEQRSLELALTGRMVPQMELDLLQQIRQLEAAQ